MAPKRKAKQQRMVVEEISVDRHDHFNEGSWPVTRSEEFHQHDAILAPGPTLQQCTGADIILSKGATMKPNLQKGKGRFLIILPGMLSWKPLAKTIDHKTTTTPTTSTTTTTTTATTSGDTYTPNLSPTLESPPSQPSPPSPPSQPSPVIHTSVNIPPKHILGTLSGLSTDTPKLTIPLPNSQNLVFSGRKVESSSRYMMLSCQPRRKSAITCKDTCQSMIVFGNGTVEPNTAITGVERNTDVSTTEEPETQRSFRHYGGSMRASDGGKPTTWSKGQQRVVVRNPVVMNNAVGDNKDHNEETSHEIPSESVDGNDSDDYVEVIHHTMEPKERTRRSLSKKVDYTQESASESTSNDDDQNDDQCNNQDDSNDEDSKVKVQTPRATNATTDSHTNDSISQSETIVIQRKQKAAPKRTRQPKRNFLEIKDNDKPERGDFKKRSTRVRTLTPKSFMEVEGGSDDYDNDEDGSNNDDDYDEITQPIRPNGKSPATRRTRATKPSAPPKEAAAKPKTSIRRAAGKKILVPKLKTLTRAPTKVDLVSLNGSKCEPITMDEDFNDSTSVKTLTPKKVSSLSPRNQTARRKLNKTLKEAVEDVNDGANWTINVSSD
jgi:hypothetical protein